MASRRFRRTLLVGSSAIVLLLAPSVVVASHGFTDVPDDQTFHAAISWMADNRVTLGCNPPANTRYCPDGTVTRGQMAAFLRRLSTGQIVDAASIQGYAASNFVKTTDTIDAATLDGLDSLDFLKTTDTVDADSVGGILPGNIATTSDVAAVPGVIFSGAATIATANLTPSTYWALPMGSAGLQTVAADAMLLTPSSFVTSNFVAKSAVEFAVTPSNVTITLVINGSPTAAACSFNTATANSCSSTAAVTVVAGDEIAIEITYDQSPTSLGRFMFAVEGR